MNIIEGQRRPRSTPKPLNLFLEFEPEDEPDVAEPVIEDASQSAIVASAPASIDEPTVDADAAFSPEDNRSQANPDAERRKPRRQRGRDRRGRRNRDKGDTNGGAQHSGGDAPEDQSAPESRGSEPPGAG